MFYWLGYEHLYHLFSPFRIFQYATFRTAMASLTAVSVGEGSKIERAVVLNGSEIGPRCTLQDCIVAAGVRIGEGTVVSGGAVLGEGVTVGERNVLSRGVRVFPQTELPDGAITF